MLWRNAGRRPVSVMFDPALVEGILERLRGIEDEMKERLEETGPE